MDKKAVIIGGSNGIGLALANKLIDKGYQALILDRCEPEVGSLPVDKLEYQYCNLLDLDHDLISSLAADLSVSVLVITAGFVSNDESSRKYADSNLMKIDTI